MTLINKLISDLQKGIKKIKGCRESLEQNSRRDIILRCGDKDNNSIKKNAIAYCTDCQWKIDKLKAKLEILNQIKPLIEKAKEDLKDELWCDNQCIMGKEYLFKVDVMEIIDKILGGKEW